MSLFTRNSEKQSKKEPAPISPAPKVSRMMLRFTGVSDSALTAAGFETDADTLFYSMGDLHIYLDKKRFYYWTPEGKKKTLRNTLQVSNLVYGNTDYLR